MAGAGFFAKGRVELCAHASGRRGFTAIEAIVVLAIVIAAGLVLLMMLPRGREHARLAACQKNLAQIGFALAYYDQTFGHLPAIETLGPLDDTTKELSAGPLRTLLLTMQLADFTELKDGKSLARPQPELVPGEMAVPGFVCPSDPNALAGHFRAPVSYRATAGDSPVEGNGAFAAGRVRSLKEIESADGLSYTAGFAERLVGDNKQEHPALFNYQAVPGTITAAACPEPGNLASWRGDAGSSWTWADYRSTLYLHALPPNAQESCIALDGQSALITASSGHLSGINVLLLDGSVSLVRPAIDLKVWKELAKIGTPLADE